MFGSATQNPIMTTVGFLQSLGINTHVLDGVAQYSDAPAVISQLHYLGISNLRDGFDPANQAEYVTLGRAGMKFDFTMYGGGDATIDDIKSGLASVDQLNAAVPGAVAAVEGANEISNWPITYQGGTGIDAAVAFQADLYSLAHGDSALPGVQVYYFTDYGMGGVPEGPNPSTTPGLADFDNAHPYPQNGLPPLEGLAHDPGAVNPLRADALTNENPATGPAVYTETGYNMNADGSGLRGAAIGDLELLLDDAQQGIAKTYLYELQTETINVDSATTGLGLFQGTTPSLAATAIHNLTTTLGSAGGASSTGGAIGYSVNGLPASTGHAMEFVGGNGTSFVAIWNETSPLGQKPAPTNVTVDLARTSSVTVFDPIVSAAPTATLDNTGSVKLGLTDEPIILRVTPQSPATADTLTLRVSEDSYQGDARFVVRVDGQQVGDTMTASALHVSGDANACILTGHWGQGIHDVQLQFLNDAYGGTPSTDRNLYVNSIAYDGKTYAGTSLTMLSAGTADFSVSGSTATTTNPADQLTLHLSEDSWNGNAQFVLSIDGKAISTPQSVTAVHSAGAWQDVTFTGQFGTGSHQIGVTFTNDAYGGTATTDRNLYINGVDCNGHHYGAGVTTLLTNGMAAFTITTSH